MSCHVMSCHVMSCHVTPCHVMSRHITSHMYYYQKQKCCYHYMELWRGSEREGGRGEEGGVEGRGESFSCKDEFGMSHYFWLVPPSPFCSSPFTLRPSLNMGTHQGVVILLLYVVFCCYLAFSSVADVEVCILKFICTSFIPAHVFL